MRLGRKPSAQHAQQGSDADAAGDQNDWNVWFSIGDEAADWRLHLHDVADLEPVMEIAGAFARRQLGSLGGRQHTLDRDAVAACVGSVRQGVAARQRAYPELARDPNRAWVGEWWPLFYAGHSIELGNLKRILEYRHGRGLPVDPVESGVR